MSTSPNASSNRPSATQEGVLKAPLRLASKNFSTAGNALVDGRSYLRLHVGVDDPGATEYARVRCLALLRRRPPSAARLPPSTRNRRPNPVDGACRARGDVHEHAAAGPSSHVPRECSRSVCDADDVHRDWWATIPGSTSASLPIGSITPALLTQRSIRPKRSVTDAASASGPKRRGRRPTWSRCAWRSDPGRRFGPLPGAHPDPEPQIGETCGEPRAEPMARPRDDRHPPFRLRHLRAPRTGDIA